jgi:hypothetical protein
MTLGVPGSFKAARRSSPDEKSIDNYNNDLNYSKIN